MPAGSSGSTGRWPRHCPRRPTSRAPSARRSWRPSSATRPSNWPKPAATTCSRLLADRREAAFERTRKRLEGLYGTLDEAQRRALREALANSPFDPARWLADRRERQQALQRLLRAWQTERPDQKEAQAALGRLLTEALHPSDPAAQAYQRRLADANCALAAQMHRLSTPDQRREAVSVLRGWETDLRALASRR